MTASLWWILIFTAFAVAVHLWFLSRAQGPSGWRYLGNCTDGERFEIGGVNVWDHEWHRLPRPRVEVRDPLYRQAYAFDVYEIRTSSRLVEFAAGEFSANIWGFYVPPPASWVGE